MAAGGRLLHEEPSQQCAPGPAFGPSGRLALAQGNLNGSTSPSGSIAWPGHSNRSSCSGCSNRSSCLGGLGRLGCLGCLGCLGGLGGLGRLAPAARPELAATPTQGADGPDRVKCIRARRASVACAERCREEGAGERRTQVSACRSSGGGGCRCGLGGLAAVCANTTVSCSSGSIGRLAVGFPPSSPVDATYITEGGE